MSGWENIEYKPYFWHNMHKVASLKTSTHNLMVGKPSFCHLNWWLPLDQSYMQVKNIKEREWKKETFILTTSSFPSTTSDLDLSIETLCPLFSFPAVAPRNYRIGPKQSEQQTTLTY